MAELNDINELNERLKEAEDKAKQLQYELDASITEKEGLQIHLAENEKEVHKFQEGLKEDIKNVFNYSNSITEIDKELLEKLNGSISETILNGIHTEDKFVKICERVNLDKSISIKQLLSDVYDYLEKKDNEALTLSNELKIMSEELNEKENEYKTLHDKSEEMKEMIIEKDANTNKLSEDNNKLRSTISEKDIQIAELFNKLDILENTIQEKNNELKVNNIETSKLKHQLEELKESESRSKNDELLSRELENQVDELKGKYSQKETELTTLTSNLNTAVEERNKLNLGIKEISAEREKDLKNHKEIVDNFNNQVKVLSETIEALNQNLADASIKHQTAVAHIKKELNDKEVHIIHLNDRIKQLESNLGDENKKETEFVRLKENIDQHNAEITKLKNEIELEKNNTSNANGLYQHERDTNNELNKNNKDLHNQLNILNSQIIDLTNNNTDLTNQLELVKPDLIKLKNEKDSHNSQNQSEVTNLTNEITMLKTDISEKNAKIEELESGLKSQDTLNEVEGYKKEIQALKTNVEDLERNMNDKNEQLRVLINSHKMEIACLKESYEKKQFDTHLELEKLNEKWNEVTRYSDNVKLEEAKLKLNELFVKLKFDLQDYDYLIDRRIIANVLIRYFDKSASSKLKEQVLDTLANMLGYNNEERKLLNLNTANNGTAKNDSYYQMLVENLNNISEFINNLS
jgi:chromosome segregation ATPase